MRCILDDISFEAKSTGRSMGIQDRHSILSLNSIMNHQNEHISQIGWLLPRKFSFIRLRCSDGRLRRFEGEIRKFANLLVLMLFDSNWR
jgi:hypothetical protein